MPTVTVVNWNIQNYGPTKSGQRFGNRDVVRAIAKVVNDVNADIFVLLEVNTTHVATAQQVSDIMRAELRAEALNPDTEWRRYVLSPNTGREFYAFFVRDTGYTRPLPIVGPLVAGAVPTILGGAGQAAVTAAQFDAVAVQNLRASHFPLLSPDLHRYVLGHQFPIPPWPATRRPVLGLFWVPGASAANRLLPIVACHFAADHGLARAQFRNLRYFSLLEALAAAPPPPPPPNPVPPPPNPVQLNVRPPGGGWVQHAANYYVLLGDFNVDFLAYPGDYSSIRGTPRPDLGATQFVNDTTHLVTYRRYSPRDFHTTPELAINAYDDIFGGASPAVVGVVGAGARVINIPEQIRTRQLQINDSVWHYRELDQRGFDSNEYNELVYDYGRQLAGDPSHIINLTGSLVGGRLISDHLPVVWDITIG
jgi:hypothetical protein